tara:strand:- start:1919 stop:2131 length:213 start_codon:yes stop_codon:yes gene_type:complete
MVQSDFQTLFSIYVILMFGMAMLIGFFAYEDRKMAPGPRLLGRQEGDEPPTLDNLKTCKNGKRISKMARI